MTDLAIYEPSAVQVAIPDRNDTDSWVGVVSDIIKVANVIFDTPFVPEGLRGSAPAVAAAILAGREMGIGPMTSLQHIHVIKGKPAQSALLMRALIQSAGHKWEDGDVTDSRAVVRGCRKGESTWTEVAFTADQAKRAGIDLGKYPADKLYARATSRLARRKFADVIAGMPYSAEDLEDGADGDEPTNVGAPAPDSNGSAPSVESKPRTAQRKPRNQSPPPAETAPAASDPPVNGQQADGSAGGALPPLPGEEGAPDDPPGSERHKELIGAVQGQFKRLGFTDDDREKRLAVAAELAEVAEITSLNDLTPEELSPVADTLARCRNRDALTALLVAKDKAKDGGDGGH